MSFIRPLLLVTAFSLFVAWAVEKSIPPVSSKSNEFSSIPGNDISGIYINHSNSIDMAAIAMVITAWGQFRDRGQWDNLRDTFWPEGTISLSWFDGQFSEFVNESQAMTNRSNTARHVIHAPYIQISKNRAIAETGATLTARADLKLFKVDVTSHIRFYDYIEKRDNVWRIVKRTGIYEKDRMDPVSPSILFYTSSFFIDLAAKLKNFPESCKYLAFGLARTGYPVMTNIVEDKSPDMQRLYNAGNQWLSQASDSP